MRRNKTKQKERAFSALRFAHSQLSARLQMITVSLMLTADDCQPHSITTTITFMCMTIITYSVAKMNDINNSTSSDKIHFLEKDMLGNVTEKFIFDFTQLLLRKLSLIRGK